MRTPQMSWTKFAAALAPLTPYGVFFGPDGAIYGPDGSQLVSPTDERQPRETRPVPPGPDARRPRPVGPPALTVA
jgi:hypothetical protein